MDVESSANRVSCVCSPCTSVYRAGRSRLQPARYTDVQGLQTHETLLTDDSTSTGLFRDQVIPYLNVHVWSSWWWVDVTPETCRVDIIVWNKHLRLLHQVGVFIYLLFLLYKILWTIPKSSVPLYCFVVRCGLCQPLQSRIASVCCCHWRCRCLIVG